jgi:hypothetical protein
MIPIYGCSTKPNIAWVGDLTEIPTDEGKLHL